MKLFGYIDDGIVIANKYFGSLPMFMQASLAIILSVVAVFILFRVIR